jgi:hypothetical protein
MSTPSIQNNLLIGIWKLINESRLTLVTPPVLSDGVEAVFELLWERIIARGVRCR